MELSEFQTLIGLRFNKPELLQEALTHRSYLNEHDDEALRDNERLEFLGDSILDYLVTHMLFSRYPDMAEGELTRLRAALVRTETLAEVAGAIRIGEALRMGRGEESSGGRQRRNIRCDAFEALLGALYLDQGLDAVKQFALPLLLPRVDYILAEGLHWDARSMLQEWSQAVHGLTPVYRVVDSSGPDHDKDFRVEVVIGERVFGAGSGKSKQMAAQAAARGVLRQIEEGQLPAELMSSAGNL